MNGSMLLRCADSGTVSGSGSAIEIAFALRYCVDGEWRKLHNEELNVLYHSRIISREIKSRIKKWVG